MTPTARTPTPSPPIRPLPPWLAHWAPIWARFARTGATLGLTIGQLILAARR